MLRPGSLRPRHCRLESNRPPRWRGTMSFSYRRQLMRGIAAHKTAHPRRSACSRPGRAARYGEDESPPYARDGAPPIDCGGTLAPEIEPFERVDAVHRLVVDLPAFPPQKRVDAPVAVADAGEHNLSNTGDDASCTPERYEISGSRRLDPRRAGSRRAVHQKCPDATEGSSP